MNVQRIEVLAVAGRIVMRLWVGHASNAPVFRSDIAPELALSLLSQLENAVHATCPDGLPGTEEEMPAAARIAAGAAKPIALADDEAPLS